MTTETTYRFDEFVDNVATGTFLTVDSVSLPMAIIQVAGMDLEDEATGGLVLPEYDFTPPYIVRFDNIEYRLHQDAEPELPEPCFEPVVLDTAGETVSVCHRTSGHPGECSDWAPDECIVADCACTEVEEPAEVAAITEDIVSNLYI